jgi:hypothetical protein
MEKAMRPAAMAPQSQFQFKFQQYFERLDPGVEFADLFDPTFWIHVRRKLNQFDIVRVVAYDNSFDVHLTVQSMPGGGVVMRFLYGDPGPKVDDPFKFIRELRESRATPSIVPMDPAGTPLVKIQYIPATKWRLLGLDGGEVQKDMETREDAEKVMGEYLAEINMRLPTDEERAAHAAAQTKPQK